LALATVPSRRHARGMKEQLVEPNVQIPSSEDQHAGISIHLRDGQNVLVRPIRSSDAIGLVAFHERLSALSIHNRYFGVHPNLTSEEVRHSVDVDGHERFALVALLDERIVGVARYEGLSDGGSAEVAFIVTDAYQRQGLATHFLDLLARRASASGYRRLIAQVLATNSQMLDVFTHCGLPVEFNRGREVVEVAIALDCTSSTVEQDGGTTNKTEDLPP
jgi:RimJ/RimL family protein N-acetyltransferase